MKIAVLGATGYTGMVLLRLLTDHPAVEKIIAVSSSRAGARIEDHDPGFPTGAKLQPEIYLDLKSAHEAGADAVFACLPHLKSAELCAEFIGKSVVIDLSADFRIEDPGLFERAYGASKPQTEKDAVYGLVEVERERIAQADLIANPGCYPTASLLPLLPLVGADLIGGPIVINAISGISGAGRKASENLLFCERSENAGAYNPGSSHRHWSEIREKLSLAGSDGELCFTPHLAPLRRGMEVSTWTKLKNPLAAEEIRSRLQNFYASAPFVRVLENRLPQTREVNGSNRCDIGLRVEGDQLQLFSCIDNLMKGASGQAVQNMNIRFGLEESAGLPLAGLV